MPRRGLMDNGKVILVTGASTGFGRLIAETAARKGYRVFASMRNVEGKNAANARELGELANRESVWLRALELDVTDDASAERAVAEALREGGRIDVLVNNAGWAPPRTPVHRMSQGDLDRILAVNLRAPIALARLAAAAMIEQAGGTIVNIASAAAHHMAPGEAVYAASKAGLIAFTRSAFAELRMHDVKMSAIVPGLVDTALIPDNKRLNRASMLKPEDVAAAVMQVVHAAPGACPVEIVLEPQLDPMRK